MAVGCLLLHGYGGRPFEMEPVAAVLEKAGIRCLTPLLPGHGADPQAFFSTGFSDWCQAAETSLGRLKKQCDHVFLAGLSMGGSIALRLAEHHHVDGVATISSPVFLYRVFPWFMPDWRLPLVPILSRCLTSVPAPLPDPSSREIAPWKGYEGFHALGPMASLLKGLRRVRADLSEITAPLLVIHSLQDSTCSVHNAWEIIRRAGSARRRMEILSIHEQITSAHVLTTHRETRDRVAILLRDFITGDL